MAQGAFAASFFISGERFKLSVDTLRAEGLSLYGMVDVTRRGKAVPVIVTGARRVQINGLCQSIFIPIPVLGPFTIRLTGGEGKPATATNAFLDTDLLAASSATMNNVDIGVAAGSMTIGEVNSGDENSKFFAPNTIALQGTSATLTNVRATGVAATMGSITLPGMKASMRQGDHQCF
ncbi:DUF6230 family protein [Streptomyces sp. NBC_01233]|uniref:DUF6230 family protein n=1 Tax=Streptomyces sp. NBC_01233 TaxID=2903787 RepID=UPI002E0DE500|nr:DUF6230 family protein [Streptomyces sp. NBC_01233]